MSASFDLHMREASFRHRVLTKADGSRFAVLTIDTPSESVNLFTGSDPVSYDDTQAALGLAETAGYFWRDIERLYEQHSGGAVVKAVA